MKPTAFIVVFDNGEFCWPMRWDDDCEGAICTGRERAIALFDTRDEAQTAITISRKFAELQKAQDKIHNSDFIKPDLKHVKIVPCE
jgi:hypothetical protein